MLLLVCSCTFTLYAQETTDSTMAGKTKIKSDDSKTKIKDDKGKIKDADGKMKVKDNADMNSDNEKTKMKDDKVKIKDAEGKVKIKGEGNMNTNSGTMNNGMSTMNTSTSVNVVTIGGWTTNPPTLPVVGTGVSTDVVATLKNKYGANLYDIKQIKSTSGQLIYLVRVMDNGGMRSEYVGADGSVVSQ